MAKRPLFRSPRQPAIAIRACAGNRPPVFLDLFWLLRLVLPVTIVAVDIGQFDQPGLLCGVCKLSVICLLAAILFHPHVFDPRCHCVIKFSAQFSEQSS